MKVGTWADQIYVKCDVIGELAFSEAPQLRLVVAVDQTSVHWCHLAASFRSHHETRICSVHLLSHFEADKLLPKEFDCN